jgi:hypothetical protein
MIQSFRMSLRLCLRPTNWLRSALITASLAGLKSLDFAP